MKTKHKELHCDDMSIFRHFVFIFPHHKEKEVHFRILLKSVGLLIREIKYCKRVK